MAINDKTENIFPFVGRWQKFYRKQGVLFIVISAILAVALVLAVIFGIGYYRARQELGRLANPATQQSSEKDIQNLVSKVGKLIELPTGEEPTVATVVNVEALAKEQPFYKNAKNGDRLLVYLKAQKAILYNPDKNILVNVGPVYTSVSSTAGSKTAP